MANDLSTAFETVVLNSINATTGYTAPTTLWVGLCTALPVGTNAYEMSATNAYSRVTMAMQTATAATGTVVAASATGPTGVATFPQATGTWGTINGYAVFKASSGSDGASMYLWKGEVNPTVAVVSGDTVSFAAGAMTLTMG
jgi:hypothetical protein